MRSKPEWDKPRIKNDPRGYEDFIKSRIENTNKSGVTHYFKEIDKEYILSHPEWYKNTVLMAIKRHPRPVMKIINKSFIKQNPQLYEQIITAAIAQDPDSYVHIKSWYMYQFPKGYEKHARIAIENKADPAGMLEFFKVNPKAAKELFLLGVKEMSDDAPEKLKQIKPVIIAVGNALFKATELAEKKHKASAYKESPDAAQAEFHTKNEKAYEEAETVMTKFAKKIIKISNKYMEGEINLEEYKLTAQTLFEAKQPELEILATHRGWKQVLLNVLAAIASLGGTLIAAAILQKKNLLLFNPETDSSKKVRELRSAVDSIKEIEPGGNDIEEENTEENTKTNSYKNTQ